jgi:hypothetical protein
MSLRSDSILDDPSPATADDVSSETPTSEADESQSQSTASETPAAAQQTAPATAQEHDGDAEDEVVPENLDGLKRALAAARGDKRKARKQWHEVEKRQAAIEAENAMLRQQIAQASAPKQQPASQPVDESTEYWADPLKYTQTILDKRISAIEEARTNERVQLSIELVKSTKPDAEDAFKAFDELAARTPGLLETSRQQPIPAAYAYQIGKEQLARQKYGGSVEEMRAKLEAEIRAELSGQHATTPTTAAAPKPRIPTSIAGARGTGVGTTRQWSGPMTLDDMLA